MLIINDCDGQNAVAAVEQTLWKPDSSDLSWAYMSLKQSLLAETSPAAAE